MTKVTPKGKKKSGAKAAPAKKALAKKSPVKKAVTKKALAKKVPAKKRESSDLSVVSDELKLLGKRAPAFKLADQSGKMVSSSSLKGTSYILYFYPKDNTPGCTTESCNFRDELGNFRNSSVTIFGVSPDSVTSHARFAEKQGLPFSLLSDPDKKLAQAYGVWALKKNYGREYWGIVRSTFLIASTGKVVRQWRKVRVKGHVEEVLEEVKSQ